MRHRRYERSVGGTGVSSGGTASVAVNFTAPLLGSTNYHWRARACDRRGACSAWAPFGGNSTSGDGRDGFPCP